MKDALTEALRASFTRVHETSGAVLDAIRNGDPHKVSILNEELRAEMGAKDAAVDALNQHRFEHGC
jgi:hypothetical protein